MIIQLYKNKQTLKFSLQITYLAHTEWQARFWFHIIQASNWFSLTPTRSYSNCKDDRYTLRSSLAPIVSGVRVARSLVLCVVFCRLLFVLFHLAIVLSLLRFTASDYAFCIFKPFSESEMLILQSTCSHYLF